MTLRFWVFLTAAYAILFQIPCWAIKTANIDRYSIRHHSLESDFIVVGDIDGDGINDIVTAILSYMDDSSPVQAGALRGISSATGNILYSETGEAFDSIGRRIIRINDRNGDGFPDLFVEGDELVSIRSGLDGTEIHRIESTVTHNQIQAIDDLNQDGVADFAYRGFVFDSPIGPQGAVYLIDGTDLSVLSILSMGERNFYGQDFVTAPDLDGDDIGEIVVMAGSALSDVNAPPDIVVYAGADRSVITEFTITEFDPAVSYNMLNTSVNLISDVDDDGVPDFVVASTAQVMIDDVEVSQPVIDMYSGADHRLLHRHTEAMGQRVSSRIRVGHFDNDTILDFAVGVNRFQAGRFPSPTPSGQILIFSGADGQLLQRFTDNHSEARFGEQFEISDINGDDVVDLVAGRFTRFESRIFTSLGTDLSEEINTQFLSGGWVDYSIPLLTNQGVFFEFTGNAADAGPIATLIWYGYEGEQQRWLIGAPTSVPSSSSTMRFSLFSADGAQFGDQFAPEDVSRHERGVAVMHIGSCDAIDLHVSLANGEQQSLSLEPFLRSVFDLDCENLASKSMHDSNRTGIWWNSVRDGEGYFISSVDTPEGLYTFLTWFAYNNGEQLWVSAGDFIADTGSESPLTAVTTRRPGDYAVRDPFGTLFLDFDSCGSGTVRYESLAESVVGEQSGTIEIRDDFTGDVIGTSCQE